MRDSGYGATVRSAGDVNGDGFGDVIIGQPRYSGKLEYQGRAHVHYGSRRGLFGSSVWRPPGERFGFEYRSVVVPFPGMAWKSLLIGAAGAGIFLLTRSYYRRRERATAALRSIRETTLRQERDRVARDLHDQLGAHLTEIARASGNARRTLSDTAQVERSLRAIEARARELVDSLDGIVWLTHPGNDSLRKTVSYLTDRIAETLHAAGLTLELDVPARLPEYSLESQVRRDILLSVREALHNVVKHARATRVTVSLRVESRRLRIRVQDDGHSAGNGGGARRNGNGLENMRERMRRHGGTFEIHFGNAGTCVFFDLPLPGSPISDGE